jgi:hypothetical protein
MQIFTKYVVMVRLILLPKFACRKITVWWTFWCSCLVIFAQIFSTFFNHSFSVLPKSLSTDKFYLVKQDSYSLLFFISPTIFQLSVHIKSFASQSYGPPGNPVPCPSADGDDMQLP